ncbi:uncharacterized protein TNCV_2545891 [Trichonephila clavipes]|nr:uncharacterized protein TNCV_2545891 [Trichonephila clavipes]
MRSMLQCSREHHILHTCSGWRMISYTGGELKTHRAVELMHANSVDTQSLPVDMVWREVDISSLSFVCGSKLRGPLPIATLLFQREP